MRILIVDDDIQVLEVLYGLLQKPHTIIDCADSCAMAKNLLAENRYDWVTLDFHLGDGTGVDILKIIHDYYPATKTIFFVGETATLKFTAEVTRLGADGVLYKPTHGEELIARVHGKIRAAGGEQ